MRFKILLMILPIICLIGCASLKLSPADYSWPIETVLKVDAQGFVSEERYTFSLGVKNLFFAEFKDSTKYINQEIRIIRDNLGYYFITGKEFKNVYVFADAEGGMSLENKIVLSETIGLTNPAFNQKAPNIELLDGSNKYLLNYKGHVR
ncbi:MAG: hypothetical protein FJ214_10390 [Ignavibacteria bacterium]|nr:hypothetical protein [Ignavibacteria bacterium]